MPSKSKKQHNFMAAVANNPKFAKKTGVPQSVGEEYLKADKGHKFKEGGKIMKPQIKVAAKKPNKGGPQNQGTGKIFKTPESKKPIEKKPVGKKPDTKKPGKGDIMNKPVKQPVVKKPTNKQPKKPGGILGNILNKFGPKKPTSGKKPDTKKPGKGDIMDKPVKQPVKKLPVIGKKPEKGGDKNKYKDFIDKEKNLSNQKKVNEEMVKAQKSQTEKAPQAVPGMKKGGMTCGKMKKYAKGGSVSSRADGVAKKGRTKGKFI